MAVAAASAYLTIMPLNAQSPRRERQFCRRGQRASVPEACVWGSPRATYLGSQMVQDGLHDIQGRYGSSPPFRRQIQGLGGRLWHSSFKPMLQRAGQQLNLNAVKAPDEEAGGLLSRRFYLYSMIKVPEQASFPARSDRQRHQPELRSRAISRHHQDQWVCRLPPDRGKGDAHDPYRLGKFASGHEAWTLASKKQKQSGQASTQIVTTHRNGRMCHTGCAAHAGRLD